LFKEEQMTAEIIDGKAIAGTIQDEIKAEVEAMKAAHSKVPGLATVLVGSRKDSQTYVRMKKKRCAEVGITSFGHDLPADVSQDELLKLVQDLNANPDVHGILVQLPLPDHIDEEEILGAISLEKDVDGFHPINIGRLSMKRRDPLFSPCTPKGCIELLLRTGVEIEGKRAVVLGRSNIVGLPVSMLLLHRNATLTVCHSRTQNLPDVVREADILVAAVGRAEMVKGDWVKPGAVVIDVGVNAVDDPTREKGYRLVGDVAFEEVKEVAGAITPVPGGVGPMTIAMLLRNTMDSAKRSVGME
jgi:5,10-methylene-tetrahydrofolate dehydrogenase/methenyl tetrahydrofolate cyclohydrolase